MTSTIPSTRRVRRKQTLARLKQMHIDQYIVDCRRFIYVQRFDSLNDKKSICTSENVPLIFFYLLADTITTVMTIQDISNKLNKKTKQGDRLQFATILRAYVMDINTTSSGIISTRWFISFVFL